MALMCKRGTKITWAVYINNEDIPWAFQRAGFEIVTSYNKLITKPCLTPSTNLK